MGVGIYLKEVKLGVDKICDWEYIRIPKHDTRVYYKVDTGVGLGFKFCTLKCVEYEDKEDTSWKRWHNSYTKVELLYHGVAYFDGIRHFYLGDDITENNGYDYYPDIKGHIKTLKIINKLEQLYCRDYGK